MAANDQFLPLPANTHAKSFVVYNNKGGVGKTTIVFNFAAELAKRHPNKKILVLDLDSQCNSTSLCLGGGQVGQEEVSKVIKSQKDVVHYLQEAEFAQFRKVPSLRKYVLNVRKHREKMEQGYADHIPPNLHLVCGSLDLDLWSSVLERGAWQPPSMPQPKPFYAIYSLLHKAIRNLSADWIVVMDTNPSFSIITRLALVAAEEIIIPTTLDEFAGGGVKALLHQLGVDNSRDCSSSLVSLLERFFEAERLSSRQFTKSPYEKLPVAKIRTIVINRTPHQSQGNAVRNIMNSFEEMISSSYMNNSDVFAPPHVAAPVLKPQTTSEAIEFVKQFYFSELTDIKGAIGISHNLGLPITCLQQISYRMRFLIHAFADDDNGDQVPGTFDEDDSNSNIQAAENEAKVGVDTARFANQIQDLVELALNSSKSPEFLLHGDVSNSTKKINYKLSLVAPVPCSSYRGRDEVEAGSSMWPHRCGRRVCLVETFARNNKRYASWAQNQQRNLMQEGSIFTPKKGGGTPKKGGGGGEKRKRDTGRGKEKESPKKRFKKE